MDPVTAMVSIAAALCVGAMSPGPSFVVVARNAVARSRPEGLATALGMGTGAAIISLVAVLGLFTVLAAVDWLYAALRVAGGLYLIYLAFAIWRGATDQVSLQQAERDAPSTLASSYWLGLSTQLSNPKTIIVIGTIFASLLPLHPPLWCLLALPLMAGAIDGGWYTIVALGFSMDGPRKAYLKAKVWIDRAAAGTIAVLGVKLILSAILPGV